MKFAGVPLLIVVTISLFSGNSVRSQTKQDDWRSIGTFNGGAAIYSIYYSPGRTVRRSGFVRAWFKLIYPEGSNTSHIFALMQFNCHEGKYRILQQSIFSRGGRGTGSIKPTDWQYPDPESVPEMQYRVMCRQ